jgi:SAM-dependent methyltransferase
MAMSFEDGSFDTVSVAGSLHHLSEPHEALRQMLRVLRPGGRLIVVEMYRDGQTDAQQTHVMLHHWWASVDRLQGTVHRETYTRAEVVDLVDGLELTGLEMRDYAYLDSDPFEPTQLARQTSSIDHYIEFAAGHPDVIAHGAEIRQRLHDVGFHLATVLVAMGEKRLDQ